ncbi:hypothetical protein BDA96_05G166600 [Sorghum bicolor]|uniref:Uncharacterized protein n=1 Tax=Sorghum bicolor TaxID=4558 RepID=A0A921UFY5_SORBI|nr:hypothetical protein BDA96_05G166600 [Sorghum bicolor]
MALLPWNNFLRSLLCFIVIGFGHNQGLGIISFRSKEEERHQKEEISQLHQNECSPSFIGPMFSGLLPSVCLCNPYCKASCRFGFKIWSYSQRGYNLYEQ